MESGDAEIANEQLILLRTLYAQCDDKLKAQFAAFLIKQIDLKNAKVISHCLFEIGKLADLITVINHPLTKSEHRLALWASLIEKLTAESHRFTEADINALDQMAVGWSKKYPKLSAQFSVRPDVALAIVKALDHLRGRIDKVRYLRLKRQLFEGQNPEINTDKQVLVSRLEALGFRQEIVKALDQLDVKLYSAGTPLDFKGCMDLLRTIYEKIFEDAAKAASTKVARPLPQTGAFQPWRQYLENENVITRDEGEVAQKLYNYLSNAGAHRLGSEPEQARVTKNIVIELGLMVVGRVQTLAGAQGQP